MFIYKFKTDEDGNFFEDEVTKIEGNEDFFKKIIEEAKKKGTNIYYKNGKYKSNTNILYYQETHFQDLLSGFDYIFVDNNPIDIRVWKEHFKI